ncbi:MAG: DoxX family protein [Chloroflexota bacterium]|nr:MAG: DoxX family protein [Chloroflexota bacterium]
MEVLDVNLGLLLLRLVVGGIFAVHGYPKLLGGPEKPVGPEAARFLGPGFVQAMQSGQSGFAEALRGMGVPMPGTMAPLIGAVELFGGLLLMLGWFTRLTTILLSLDMVVAIRKVHWQSGLVGPTASEFPLSLLGGCLALFFAGPGKLSLDELQSALLGVFRRK